jgi:hypothetical protein
MKPVKQWSASGPWLVHSSWRHPFYKPNGKLKIRPATYHEEIVAMDRTYRDYVIEAKKAGMTVAEWSRARDAVRDSGIAKEARAARRGTYRRRAA